MGVVGTFSRQRTTLSINPVPTIGTRTSLPVLDRIGREDALGTGPIATQHFPIPVAIDSAPRPYDAETGSPANVLCHCQDKSQKTLEIPPFRHSYVSKQDGRSIFRRADTDRERRQSATVIHLQKRNTADAVGLPGFKQMGPPCDCTHNSVLLHHGTQSHGMEQTTTIK
ncbi:hypothetical protein L210DRAFT_318778 [Boletus edulis BED1]|uniref:Uncharacterized protein n=1 Tax=Boletus edulis BED1 TaxID=1328754 RepID=A0AAD4C087_BOLED|nr:hypothetical protein L210DRAFT_318778 [Boletus edulis BED1]